MAAYTPPAPQQTVAKPMPWWKKGLAMLPEAAVVGAGTAAGTALGGPGLGGIVGGTLGGAVASPLGAGLGAEATRGLTDTTTVEGEGPDVRAMQEQQRQQRRSRFSQIQNRWQ